MLLHENSTIDLIYSSSNDDNINNKLPKLISLLSDYKQGFVYPNDSTSLTNKLKSFINKIELLINSNIHSFIFIPILKDNKLKASYLCLTKSSGEMINNEITLNNEFLRLINLTTKQLFETIRRIEGQQKYYYEVLIQIC